VPQNQTITSEFQNKNIIFTEYSKVNTSTSTYDIQSIGTISLNQDGTGSMYVESYNAPANIFPIRGRGTPDKIYLASTTSACIQGPIYKMTNQIQKTVNILWEVSDNVITVKNGNHSQKWVFDDSTRTYMKKLNLPYNSTNGSNTIDGLNFIESRGFALLSQINDSTSQRGLTSFPDGTISAEYFTNVGTSTTPWKYGLSSTRKNLYRQATDRNVWGASLECSVDTSYFCQTNIAFNEEPDSRFFLFHYGHDYNRDGCLNETDHSVKNLGAWDTLGNFIGSVYLEYSYENDRYPTISIGRNFPKSVLDPQLIFTNISIDQEINLGTNSLTFDGRNVLPTDDIQLKLFNGANDLGYVGSGKGTDLGNFNWNVTPEIIKNVLYSKRNQYTLHATVTRNGNPITFAKSVRFTIPMNPPTFTASSTSQFLGGTCDLNELISDNNIFTGLFSVRPEVIDGKSVTGCVKANFSNRSYTNLNVKYQSSNNTCGKTCGSSYCNTGGSGLIFISTRSNSSWKFIGMLARSSSLITQKIPVSADTTSVLICKDSGGVSRDGLLIDFVNLETN
jgi:hypothetical protein